MNWLGQLRSKNGRINLKKGGIMPIFSAARVLSLRHASPEHATPKRLKAVEGKITQGKHIVENLIEAHRFLLDLILKQQLRDIETGVKLSNSVALSELTSRERQSLKWAFNQVKGIPNLFGAPTEIW
jgi:DNA polymerase-3 subunit epsilon/CBS domain-containing protein